MKKDYKDDIRAVDKPPVAEKRFSVKRLFFGTFMIMFIALACFVGGIVFINHARDTEPKAVMTSTQLSSQLEDIGELATVKYLYTNMGKFEESNEFKGFKIPFTTKRFIVTYDGIIKAGIDTTNMTIDVKDNIITVLLPPSRILSHQVDNDSLQVFDETNNIFNQIKIEDYSDFCAEQETAMEQKAIASGLLDEADEKAKSVICDILNANQLINDLYVIEFV